MNHLSTVAPYFLALIQVAFNHAPDRWIDYDRKRWAEANEDFPNFLDRIVAQGDHGLIIEIDHHRDPIGHVYMPCKIRFVFAERGEFYHGYTIRKVSGKYRIYSGPAGDQHEWAAPSRADAIEEIKEMIESDWPAAVAQVPEGVELAIECQPKPAAPIALVPQLFTRAEILADAAIADSDELWQADLSFPGGPGRSFVACPDTEADALLGESSWSYCGTVGQARRRALVAEQSQDRAVRIGGQAIYPLIVIDAAAEDPQPSDLDLTASASMSPAYAEAAQRSSCAPSYPPQPSAADQRFADYLEGRDRPADQAAALAGQRWNIRWENTRGQIDGASWEQGISLHDALAIVQEESARNYKNALSARAAKSGRLDGELVALWIEPAR